VTELPIEQNPLPAELMTQIEKSSSLCVAEEHVRHGGFGSELMLHLADLRCAASGISALARIILNGTDRKTFCGDNLLSTWIVCLQYCNQ